LTSSEQDIVIKLTSYAEAKSKLQSSYHIFTKLRIMTAPEIYHDS